VGEAFDSGQTPRIHRRFSLLPPPAARKAEATGARSEGSPAPAIESTAGQDRKKNSPLLREKTAIPKEKAVARKNCPHKKEPTREEARPPAREQIPEQSHYRRAAPATLKELLPPVGWSADGRVGSANGPIRLDTKDPEYVTYFNSIKRAIEVVWQYPELALRYGLQGRLLLEFSILGNGDIESAKIIRSSGSNLLDEEALRAR